MVVVIGCQPMTAWSQDVATSDAADDQRKQLIALVEKLGSASFEDRSSATLALLKIGKSATSVLEMASRGDDYETAVRAKALIRVIDQSYFGGLDIRLEASKSKVAWDEPFDLHMHLDNKLDVSSRVPVVLRDASDRAGIDAVTGLLDLADFLQVTGPDGSRIDLHTDDINEDVDLLTAVQQRVDGEVYSRVPPRARVTYDVEAFNRNRARYRMLQKGTYRIRLVYQPQWSDQDLIDAGVGRAQSNELAVSVTSSAPEVVRRSWREASLSLKRRGDSTEAVITNLNDVPIVVNTNIVAGMAEAPFAGMHWFVGDGVDAVELSLPNPPVADAGRFSLAKLKTVQPGESLTIARLADTLIPAGGLLTASYSNLANRTWQRMAGVQWLGNPQAPVALRKPLPRRMLMTTLRSDSVTVPKRAE